MSSRSSSWSSTTSSSDNDVTEISVVQNDSSPVNTRKSDKENEISVSTNERTKEGIKVEGEMKEHNPSQRTSEYEIIDIDELPSEKAESDIIDGNANGVVLRRSRGNVCDDEHRRNSFKKHARLSRMLQNIESSSEDDDEDLYTFPVVPRYSKHSQLSVLDRSASSSLLANDQVPLPSLQQKAMESESDDETTIPMKELSKIVNPSVLSEVKKHLKKVSRKSLEVPTAVIEPSPAKLWEMKKRLQNEKMLLNKTQATKIKAGWRVRKCLNDLPEGETVNTFYLSLAKRGMLREVEALFCLAKVSGQARNFNKNYRDDDDKSALTIAIDNRDCDMMRKLIEHGVELGMSVFHVIAADFMEGLKLLMLWDPCIDWKIERENHYFQIGMTPMILAAYNNNYRMLSLLHEYGHRLTGLKQWIEGIQVAWESANERRMICFARAQPAYITLTCEINHMNPMTYCLKEIKSVKKCESEEHEFSNFYKDLKHKLEDYMCSLLDFISSSDELADLFQFDSPPPEAKRTQQLMTYIDSAKTKRWKLGNRFELLEKASRENLVRFVTHQQSQLALAYLRFRSLPFLRSNFLAYGIGLLFPILSLFYICAPDSALGGIITLPVVSFNCHMMSDLSFAVILLLKIVIKDHSADHLGEPFCVWEWLICLYILGKWVQEAQECMNRGSKAYLRDLWNYSDLILLVLFTISIIIRVFDWTYNGDGEHTPRYEWGPLEPRLIGECLQAWGYVFVFIRILGLTRVDRNLGPLQISLAKMLGDIIRFLCLFSLVLLAFAFGLSDLYWYYGTPDGAKFLCRKNGTSMDSETVVECAKQKNIAFSSIPNSLEDLFWSLFGLFELDSMSLQGKHMYTELIGKMLLGTYHVVAIIVMLNMLIAMMSNSYNATSEDEETAWKFHRTSVWIRFIRREVVRPPPMNLFPNPWRIPENFRRFKSFLRNLCPNTGPLTESVYDDRGRRMGKSATLNSRLDAYPEVSSQDSCEKNSELDGKGNVTFGKPSCCYRKPKRKDKIDLIEREISADELQTPRIVVSTRSSAPVSRKSSFKRPKPGFSPAVLQQVKEKLRSNLHNKGSKEILEKLVRRYKLKHLIDRKEK